MVVPFAAFAATVWLTGATQAGSPPPQAAELTMPAWLEINQRAGCAEGQSSLSIRTSAAGPVVTAFQSPGTNATTAIPKISALIGPIKYIAKIRVHCMTKAAVFEIEGYDAWQGPGAHPISRRFAIGGNNFTPLP